MNPEISRREFLEKSFDAICTYFLFETLFKHDLLAKSAAPITKHWAKALDEMCLDLRSQSLTLVQWQECIETLLNQLELKEFLQFIDFDKLAHRFEFPDLGVNTKWVDFPKLQGLPPRYAFHRKIFGLKKGRAIIPHGHKNMVSAHLIIKGEFELKHYDKIEEDGGHMIIQPTIDKIVQVGSASSISDEKNNVHWFKTRSDYAFTFDVIMTDLDPRHGKPYEIDNIDPPTAEKLSGNLLRVRKLYVEEALRKYGKEMHH
jgi:hypothetical protein